VGQVDARKPAPRPTPGRPERSSGGGCGAGGAAGGRSAGGVGLPGRCWSISAHDPPSAPRAPSPAPVRPRRRAALAGGRSGAGIAADNARGTVIAPPRL